MTADWAGICRVEHHNGRQNLWPESFRDALATTIISSRQFSLRSSPSISLTYGTIRIASCQTRPPCGEARQAAPFRHRLKANLEQHLIGIAIKKVLDAMGPPHV